MPDREFTNINGIKVCDQTARNNIPTKTSQLTNDSGYITNIPDEYITEAELNAKGYATTSQIPAVPTNVSEFTNDAKYASETFVTDKIAEAALSGGDVDLSGYVTKETGNASQITFNDGQTFQAKLDAGALKGDKGDKGEQGSPGPQGVKGDAGETPNITIGTITTLEPGSNATANITGTTPNLTLNLGIPKGDKGDKGEAGSASSSDNLVTTDISNTTLSLTIDKYQTTTVVDGTEITLPTVTSFTEIHLFFETTTDLTLILPSCKWQNGNTPTISANKTYEFIFTYTTEWLGGVIIYE